MRKEIILLDQLFNFQTVYKRNYCTLLNIEFASVQIRYLFKVDGITKTLVYPESLYRVVYREWKNQNWFELKMNNQHESMFWSSPEKAKDWFNENLNQFGLERLEEEQAYAVAELNLKTHASMVEK